MFAAMRNFSSAFTQVVLTGEQDDDILEWKFSSCRAISEAKSSSAGSYSGVHRPSSVKFAQTSGS